MAGKYFGSFADRRSVADNFLDNGYHDADWQAPDSFPTEDEILFASYGGAAYEGDAIVLFEREGKLFEVHGGHCSCYGLEGQWTPEETSWAAINLRPRNDRYSSPMCDHDEDAARAFWALVDARLAADAVDPVVTDTGKPTTRDGNTPSYSLPAQPEPSKETR